MSLTTQNGCCAPPRVFTCRHCPYLATGLLHRLAVEPYPASPEGVIEAFWSLSASGELWQHCH